MKKLLVWTSLALLVVANVCWIWTGHWLSMVLAGAGSLVGYMVGRGWI